MGAHHLYVAIDPLQLVIEEMHAGATAFDHVAHDAFAITHDVGDRESHLDLIEFAEA